MTGNFIIWTNQLPSCFMVEGFFYVEGDITDFCNWSSSAWRAKHYMTIEDAVKDIEKLSIIAYIIDVEAAYESLKRIREHRI